MAKPTYINMNQPMTLDKHKDGSAPGRTPNELQELNNYVCKPGEIYVRKGITILTHTPDLTDTWEPPDIVWPPGVNTATDDFAIIAAVFPFNSSATVGHNLLTLGLVYSPLGSITPTGGTYSGHATSYIGDKIEGAGSLIMTDNTAINTAAGEPNKIWGMRTLNAFPTWMPGDSGETTKKFLLTYWIKPYNAHASAAAEWHFTFGNSSDVAKIAYGIRHFDNDLQNWWTGSGGGTISNLDLPGIIVQDEWQFVAAWYDGDTQFEGLYHYRPSTMTEVWTASLAAPTPAIGMNHFYHHSVANTINGKHLWSPAAQANLQDASDAYEGLMDYCTMWSRPMHLNNTSNITLARMIRSMAWIVP